MKGGTIIFKLDTVVDKNVKVSLHLAYIYFKVEVISCCVRFVLSLI